VATDDYAILVGISKYADGAFGELHGPPNDVAFFKAWLESPDGGDIADPSHITVITSPAAIPAGADPDSMPPVTEDFKRAFKKLVYNDQRRLISRPGRVYLYFSGHGFCERKSLTPQGALYAANATRDFTENIFGTGYAEKMKDKALFSEIVLIMDCCRDAEVNRSADVPPINDASVTAAQAVKLFCIYAAPKGGKAQERAIAERGNKVCGLLTHALLKALAEATPDAPPRISTAALKRHLLETWTAVCGDIPAPLPEIVMPTGDELYFRSPSKGVKQEFRFVPAPTADTTLEIFDGFGRRVARCALRAKPQPSTVDWASGGQEAVEFDGTYFFLPLQAGFYKYVSHGGLEKQALFAVEGGTHVDL
jgi:hypothetical protein